MDPRDNVRVRRRPPKLRDSGAASDLLPYWVRRFAVPRHYIYDRRQNNTACLELAATLESFGYKVTLQGPWANVVARPPVPGPYLLVGAHYDSVPGSPGADDNASALAVMLAAAAALGAKKPVLFVGFNREEDNLLGSRSFAAATKEMGVELRGAHVLEMVGCCRRDPGSQRNPLPGMLDLPDTGDFLGLVCRDLDENLLAEVLGAAEAVPELHLLSLQTLNCVDSMLPVVHRSDHSPLWAAGVPAVMWTDTAEYRNPHYHEPSDTADTLDYPFMQRVCDLLVQACGGAS